ncbi:MAG: GntR family transcriptional regulator, partial [Gorillibacterium sp.]|nr:GntR family transcriptional regulator [Gorillibacterium sp.]
QRIPMIHIEHTELSEKVYHLLKQMILNRDFVSGQRLDLNDLSQRMNISRTPLKEAVNRLALEGLIEVKPRSGTFVASLSTKDIDEVTEIRLMIETWCISQLTELQAQKLVLTLDGLLVQAKALLEESSFPFERYLDLDISFHSELVLARANPRMTEQYKELNSFLYASRIYFLQSYERSVDGLAEHDAIVAALKRFDLAAACQALEQHITKSRIDMTTYLQENGGGL